jgi:hypothetical protein
MLPFASLAPELEPKTIPAKRIRQSERWFEQGELSRRVLDALRRAREPIRAPDVVRAVMIDKKTSRQEVSRILAMGAANGSSLGSDDCACAVFAFDDSHPTIGDRRADRLATASSDCRIKQVLVHSQTFPDRSSNPYSFAPKAPVGAAVDPTPPAPTHFRSGQASARPEADRAAWFTLDEARVKIIRGQGVFLDSLPFWPPSGRNSPYARFAQEYKTGLYLGQVGQGPFVVGIISPLKPG